MGIRPVLDLPGVGANLSDHALLPIELPTRPSESPSRFGVHATLHSTIADPNGPPDLMMFTAGPFDADPEQIPGGAAFGIVVGLMAPRSRGWVRLTSSDPNDPPRIHFGHLTDPEDLDAMLDGITEARRIASVIPLPPLSPAPNSPPGRRRHRVIARHSRRGRWGPSRHSIIPLAPVPWGRHPSRVLSLTLMGRFTASKVSPWPTLRSCRSSRLEHRIFRSSWWRSTLRVGFGIHDLTASGTRRSDNRSGSSSPAVTLRPSRACSGSSPMCRSAAPYRRL